MKQNGKPQGYRNPEIQIIGISVDNKKGNYTSLGYTLASLGLYFFLGYYCKWKELLISASAGKCQNFLLEVLGTPFPQPPKYKLLKSNTEGNIEDERGIGQILTGWILETYKIVKFS